MELHKAGIPFIQKIDVANRAEVEDNAAPAVREIESAIVSHSAVAEAACIGKPDTLKGEIIKAFVILKQGYKPSESMLDEIKKQVRKELGPIAIPSEVEFTEWLPKTRSGKIMRRVLKAKELGVEPGDISTLEE